MLYMQDLLQLIYKQLVQAAILVENFAMSSGIVTRTSPVQEIVVTGLNNPVPVVTVDSLPLLLHLRRLGLRDQDYLDVSATFADICTDLKTAKHALSFDFFKIFISTWLTSIWQTSGVHLAFNHLDNPSVYHYYEFPPKPMEPIYAQFCAVLSSVLATFSCLDTSTLTFYRGVWTLTNSECPDGVRLPVNSIVKFATNRLKQYSVVKSNKISMEF